jgi:hypothetical protein
LADFPGSTKPFTYERKCLMNIIDIEGTDLDRLRNLFRHLEDQFASDLVWKVAIAIDDVDGAFKVKVNESVWSPPFGRKREVTS